MVHAMFRLVSARPISLVLVKRNPTVTVTDFANTLETSEFDIFCRAYTSWYGCALDRITVERDFGRYLMNVQEMPCYVRAFLTRTNVLAA